jgi:hypothetical protein
MGQTTISGHHDARYHATTMIRSFLFAAAALAAAFMFAAPAQARLHRHPFRRLRGTAEWHESRHHRSHS